MQSCTAAQVVLEADEFGADDDGDAPDLAQALYENAKATAAQLAQSYCRPFCAAVPASSPARQAQGVGDERRRAAGSKGKEEL